MGLSYAKSIHVTMGRCAALMETGRQDSEYQGTYLNVPILIAKVISFIRKVDLMLILIMQEIMQCRPCS